MALNFPDSPTLNQVYTDTTSGFSYQWDGVVWQSYSESATDNISIVDDISSLFDGVTDTFALTVSGSSISPASQQLRVVLGGIVQEPGSDYITSTSNIIFTTPPPGGLDCSIVSLGRAIPLSVAVLSDGSVTTSKIFDGSVTPSKLSTGGPSWNSGGDLTVSGNVSIAGTLTYEDVTNVDSVGLITARSGINVSGGSIVIDSGDINVSGVVTATTFIGNLTGTATGLTGTPNITVGVVTATSFIGNLTGTASTATASATAYSLTGTPTLNVGIVTVTGLDGVAYAGITSTAVDKTLINREYCTVVAAGVTITLPSSPQPGWEVGIAVDNFTDVVVAGNGSNIMALNEDFTMDIAYLALQFVYVDSVQGWRYF